MNLLGHRFSQNAKGFCPTKQTGIVVKKMPTLTKKSPKKNLYGRAEIFVIFGLYFWRNDDLINSF